MLNKIIQRFEAMNSWHFLWISILLSELFTCIMNTILSLVWWDYISIDLLLIGSIDAFIVALLVTIILIYFLNRIKDAEMAHSKQLHAVKLATSSSIAASMAHEFGNPLYGIKGVLTSIIDNENISAKTARVTHMAIDECERMSSLIQSLQDFHRPSATTKTLTSLHQIIDDIVMFSRHSLEQKGIEIKKEYAPDLKPILVILDQIKQVIINLINNSISACANGGVITISTAEEKHNCIIRISDTGHGIKEDDLSRIFDPFFSTKDVAMGTGLGLSVCYGIIRRHGGTIEVASKVGEGTTFTIILPIMDKS